MKFSSSSSSFATLVIPTLFAALTATASPIVNVDGLLKRTDDSAITVTQVLQFALTLENLESTFYSKFLSQFDAAAFESAGFPSWVRGRIAQIAEHEAIHVATLKSALGADAVAACNYSFPVTDPASFVAVAETLEGVGSSAYLGAAPSLVSSPAVLAVAGAILPIEARHNGWITASAEHQEPWSGAFETALQPNQVFTLASGFIQSCPSSNPTLPFKAFPALTIGSTAAPGQSASVDFNSTGSSSGDLFVAFLSGLNVTYVPLDAGAKSVAVPVGLQGTVYAVVTSNGSSASDANTVAGPAILHFPFDSEASNP